MPKKGASSSGGVFLFDANSGELIDRLPSQSQNKIRALAYSPDGGTLGVASEDKNIYVWHPDTGELAGTLTGHTDSVFTLAFHPDGSTLASGSADRTIRIWDWRRAQPLHILFGNLNWVTDVAFNPDGALLASGGYDRTVRLWQVQTSKLLHTIQGTTRFVNEVVHSPDGSLLASATFDQPVHLWNCNDGRLLHALGGHRSSIRRIVFSPDNQTLATGGDGSKIRLWDTQTGNLRQVLDVDGSYIRTLTFSPDNSYLAAGIGLGHGSLVVWKVKSGQIQYAADDVCVGLGISFGFSPDGRFLAYSDWQCAIHLVRVADWVTTCTVRNPPAPTRTMRFSPTGSHLATQNAEGKLCVWELAEDGAMALLLEVEISAPIADLWNLVFSPDGQMIGFQMDAQTISLIDLHSGQVSWSTPKLLYGENSLAFTADGTALIAMGMDGKIHLLDTASGKLLRTLANEFGAVRKISSSPAKNRVAGSGDDGAIRIWDTETGDCQLALKAPLPYEDLDITNATGIPPAQVATLQSLGAKVAESGLTDRHPLGLVHES